MKISTMHKETHRDFIDETYRPKLPLYKKIVEKKLLHNDENKQLIEDLENIDLLLEN